MRKLLLLILVLGILGVVIDYQRATPGDSIVDRFWAKSVIVDFDQLNPESSPAQIQKAWHHLRYTCASESGALGDHVCWAPLSQFNAVDARIIAFFFREQRLSAVRVSFTSENHPQILSILQTRFGSSRTFGTNRDVYGNNIIGWAREQGIVAINDKVGPKQEALVLWLSRDQVLRGIRI